ncbi:MAG: uridine diphosphate-N-acetylglucosamine-binding protein YvcK, partial [Acidimicrobiales bacterium]|nr:uridine diphosphate-N-acetylglucosamine-binding protein YvcK [Acidimicrobiales bacterium]
LGAAKHYAGQVTGIVSVADDGGSSGRLRLELGAVPPGDLRKCLAALGQEESLWCKALEHRFAGGDLAGHALGNLLIVGLAEATGDLQLALDEVGKLAGATGRVVPATTVAVVLTAAVGGGEVRGQAAVAQATDIHRLSMVPPEPAVSDTVIEALRQADQVVLGPGSLYTSVLAVAAVPAIREVLAELRGQAVYVCNLHAERGETAGYDVARHVEALIDHGVHPDVVLCDSSSLPLGSPRVRWVDRPLSQGDGSSHSAARLGAALAELLEMSRGAAGEVAEDGRGSAPFGRGEVEP